MRRSAGERVSDQCVVSSIKHGGGSVIVWGCFGNNSLEDLKRIEGKLVKEKAIDKFYRGTLFHLEKELSVEILFFNKTTTRNTRQNSAKIICNKKSGQESSKSWFGSLNHPI